MTPRLEASKLEIRGRLQPTELEVAAGALVAIIGPNGGGKTSLLRALAGIELTTGSVTVDGEDLTSAPRARRPRLATFLPASRDIHWPIGASDLIALGLPRANPHRLDALLNLLELQELENRGVDQLSAGERTRVLFARALAPRPKLLLLDEPLSNLDPYWQLRLLAIIREELQGGASALLSLHDIDRLSFFDRAILIHQGRVSADLPPDDMIASTAFEEAFRIERDRTGWRLRPAGPRSSP